MTTKSMGQTPDGEWFDPETGEVVDREYTAMLVPKKQRYDFKEGWFAMARSAPQVFKDITSVQTQRVLWALLEQLDFSNLIAVSQKEIAEDLDMRPANVSRAIRWLVDNDVIIKGPKIGQAVTYRLNPNLGWRGSPKTHKQAKEQNLRDRIAAANIRGVYDGTEPATDA